MKNQFVPYELSEKLREVGFDEPCICGYDKEGRLRGKLAHSNDTGVRIDWDKHDNHLPAPLWQQAFNWFIEKHQLNGVLYYNFNGKWSYDIQRVEARLLSGQVTAYLIKENLPYIEVQGVCLERLIETIQSKKNE